ncbi:MAG: TPM domain-containing protein [Polyangiales bacterium]
MTDARCWLLVMVTWLTATTVLALDVPRLGGRVNDYAGLLSPATEAEIGQRLEALEQDTGTQVVVLTVESLEGEQLEEYSLWVAETWALGRADQDDGALLLIAKNDRKMRIEVGYGLEPTLTDIMSKRILDQILRPRFRSGDFDGGVLGAVDAIDGLVRGTSTLPPPDPSAIENDMPPRFFGVIWLLFLIPFVLVVVGTNPFQWFLYVFLIPFVFVGGMTAVAPWAAPFFVGAWLIGAPIVWSFFGRRKKKQPRGKRSSRSGTAWSSGGGWYSGGGWSSGGGGFSGGGGSFGGGGSSGSW